MMRQCLWLLLGGVLVSAQESELVVPGSVQHERQLDDGKPKLAPTEPNLCLFQCIQDGLSPEDLDFLNTAAQAAARPKRDLSAAGSMFDSQLFNASMLATICKAYTVSSTCSETCSAPLPPQVRRGLESLGRVKYMCSDNFISSIPCFTEHRRLIDAKCSAVRPKFEFGNLGKDCKTLETATTCATPMMTIKCGPIAGSELGFIFAKMSHLALLDLADKAGFSPAAFPKECEELAALAESYDRSRKLFQRTEEEMRAPDSLPRQVLSAPSGFQRLSDANYPFASGAQCWSWSPLCVALLSLRLLFIVFRN